MTTETLEPVRERAAEIEGWLNEVGIKTKPYVNPPLDRDVFAMNLEGNSLRFWPAIAQVEVATDKDKKQAVMVVTEDRREITRVYQLQSRQNFPPTREDVFRRFPVQVPRRRFGKFSVRDLTSTQVKRQREEQLREAQETGGRITYYTSTWEVTATIIVPPTETTFLVGFDERRQFICMLPERVESVKQAHKVLRPAGISSKALRHGEWFLDPVSNDIRKKIEAHILRHPTQVAMRPLESYSSHWAVTVRVEKQTYANMVVYDTRQDRHGPINLDGWHRVVRNNEVVPRSTQQRNTQRMWD